MRKSVRLFGFVLAFVMLAAACGQKPGVHTRGARFAGETGGAIAGEEAAAEGEAVTGSEGSTSSGASGSSSSSSGSSATTAGGGGAAGDTTGVTATSIRVGFHAPITGASAVALSDIRLGTDLLRDYLKKRGVTIHGRSTITFVKDDQYNPSHAVSVCRELVEQKKVFMLVGGGGTDQVQACARYASTKGVPYLSAGVTENVLKNLKNYFAFSATYPDQAKPLVSMIKNFVQPPISINTNPPAGGGAVMQDRCVTNKPEAPCLDPTKDPTSKVPDKNAKVGIIYSDTEGFHDARDAFLAEFEAQLGRRVDKVESITKFVLSGTDANSKMLAFRNDGIDVIYVLTSPTNWLELLNRANGQRYWPKWVGVGVTMGLNLVADLLGCGRYPKAIHGSLVFSPWFSTRHGQASDFATAWREAQAAGKADTRDYKKVDLAFAVWGGSMMQAALLHNAGKNLNRRSFIQATEKVQNFNWNDSMGAKLNKVNPDVSYSPTNHFGATQVHLLWANCDSPDPGGPGGWDFHTGVGHFASSF